MKKRHPSPHNEFLNFEEPKRNGNPLATAIIILAIIGVIWGIYFFITF